ncbi:MAG: OmpA family protein [Saprospiraceae bacterium]|nr:OmpA family protein [Saprospiraceae bacterium]
MRSSHLLLTLCIGMSLLSCVGKKKHNEIIEALKTTHVQQVDSVQSQLDTARTTIRSMELDLAERKGENNALTAMQDKLQGKIDGLEESLENLGARATNQQNDLGNQLDIQKKELTDKLTKVKAIKTQIEDSRASMLNTSSALLAVLEKYDTEEYAVEIQSGKVVVALTEKLLFRSGSTSRMTDDGVEAIEKLSEVLNNYPLFAIQVIGHTDNRPVPRKGLDRWNYSALRASTITKMMVEDFDVNPNQILAASKADYAPRTSNESSEGRAKNKRIELIVAPRQDLLVKDIEKALTAILGE